MKCSWFSQEGLTAALPPNVEAGRMAGIIRGTLLGAVFGGGKSEIVLEISDCQAAILSEPANIRSGGHRIDHRKLNHGHMDRLHSSG